MEKVLEQARLLAEAIAESDVYQHMRQCENDAMKDPEATKLIADFVEKRQKVESLLAEGNMDHTALAEASQAMEAAEKMVNQQPMVRAMQDARNQFTQMMENVNQILRFIITGETEESGGCSGSCESCGGAPLRRLSLMMEPASGMQPDAVPLPLKKMQRKRR